MSATARSWLNGGAIIINPSNPDHERYADPEETAAFGDDAPADFAT